MPGAIADLGSLADRLRPLSDSAANRLVISILNRSTQLAEFPNSGRVVPETSVASIREVIEGEYRVLYQVFADRVEVIAVLHGRSKFPG